MKVLVKRENWDGGIWLNLPVTEEEAKQMYEQLKQIHPSAMVPFIGDVTETGSITNLKKCLQGELVFSEGHLELFNSLAERIERWRGVERILFNAALEMERPDTIEKVMGVTGHLEEYESKNDITTMYQLGMNKLKEMKLHLPLELEKYFDYELFGRLNKASNEVMTDYGLVQRKKLEPNITQRENPDAVRFGSMIFEVRVPSNENHYERYRIGLPMKEADLEKEGNRLGMSHLAEMTDFDVSSKISYLDSYLPPQSTIGEFNQVAWEIWKLADRKEVSRRKLLAILEAEAPRTINKTCWAIRGYSDYEILPEDIIKPDDYAHYLLNLHHIEIPKELEPCVRFQDYGLKMLNGAGPYRTSYGPVINKLHALQQPDGEIRKYCLYNSLALASYWYERESSLPEMLTGEEAISYKEIVEQKITKSLLNYGEQVLAESLYNEVLKRRIVSMVPGVTEYAGELWGILTVTTYGELTDRETEGIKAEWQTLAESGWGGQLMESPIRLERGELYVGFWDRDNNENLFIKTEEEFKQGFQSGPELG